jgi:SAM-dependent methyltransferase
MTTSHRAKQLLGPRAVTRIRCLMRGLPLPRWGNLRRTQPFSVGFGFDRGTPIDRHYLHRFLEAHREAISGDVLEIQTDGYSRRYGRALRRVDTFDIVPDCHPTYLCDLASAGDVLPAESYDCVLMPNTLQHLRDLEAALQNALRVIRVGGVLLASAAGLEPLTADTADYWRLSPDGWRVTLARIWPGQEVIVEGHGNCLAAVAAQLGLAVEELTSRELDVNDPRYPVLTTVFCRKRSSCGLR